MNEVLEGHRDKAQGAMLQRMFLAMCLVSPLEQDAIESEIYSTLGRLAASAVIQAVRWSILLGEACIRYRH